MTYIWFYDITIVQPYFAVSEYGTDGGVIPEYGAFVAMDNGMCTLRETTIPEQCLQFSGLNYNPNLGPYVGGEPRKTHPKGNYADNVWFSFPGPCFIKPFDQKSTTCRNDPAMKGGLCPKGVAPDGVTCTYSFDVLGYVSIDDLVGITSLPVPGSPTQNFTDRVQFCKAGGIEYNFDTSFSNLTFWNDPLNVTANAERTKKMMTLYSDTVTAGKGVAANFKPFPNVTDLTAANPPCYVNNILCSQNALGCRRRLLAQVCELCTVDSPECVTKEGLKLPPSVNRHSETFRVPNTHQASVDPMMLGHLFAFVAASVVTAVMAENTWKMTPVRSIQARVQSDPPVWDADNNVWVAVFKTGTNTFNEKYVASLDTVNTASVEGALMYVQSEGIDQAIVPGCSRKSNMSYVWFYDITIVQPTYGIAEYGSNTAIYPEYCQFVAMDNGMCTPTAGTTLPKECLQYFGGNGQPNIGPCVGGENRLDNPKAPYDNNVWFSFPNSCFTKPFGAKSDACRAQLKGGLCPLGVVPDGVACTFSYNLLGYVNIDDLVGITSMTSSAGEKYPNRYAFCQDGGIEYSSQTGQSLPFWENPTDRSANTARSQKMIQYYGTQVADPVKGANMKAFPDVATLAATNPPCYVNSPLCSSAKFGCRRKLLAQLCEVCTVEASDCIKRPAGTPSFPALEKATRSSSGGSSGSSTASGSDQNDAAQSMAHVGVLLLVALALCA
ncbi:hypothetical protein DYB35_007053 [Aphanomyces astaci]|uniref:Uncharacterized protein n=2 Tax=Aphanomyces astaci TaxID=112090 RepID=A0A418DIF2_APHAT|nr:hypothetical protein DYB35_007053 [Aphanomyces astaci]